MQGTGWERLGDMGKRSDREGHDCIMISDTFSAFGQVANVMWYMYLRLLCSMDGQEVRDFA